jgi:signal transduction histidine kinase
VLATGIQTAVVGWGMFIRSQRELLLALRERTRQAEAERDLRVDQARAQERTRIAREMHDVLAHRLSLLSLHAGALEVRPDAPPEQMARAAAVVRASAHQALEDLRQVIDVLRAAEPADGEKQRPQPTLRDVAALVEESRDAGTAVELEQRVDAEDVPAATGRTVYRIVQEGLTNALKHAKGAHAEVVVRYVDSSVELEIADNGPGAATEDGMGHGLVGMRERVALYGGTIQSGPRDGGGFVLRAQLPVEGHA